MLGNVQFISTSWICTWLVLRSKCVNRLPSGVFHVGGGKGVWFGKGSTIVANPASSASTNFAVSRSDSSQPAWSASLLCRFMSGRAR